MKKIVSKFRLTSAGWRCDGSYVYPNGVPKMDDRIVVDHTWSALYMPTSKKPPKGKFCKRPHHYL